MFNKFHEKMKFRYLTSDVMTGSRDFQYSRSSYVLCKYMSTEIFSNFISIGWRSVVFFFMASLILVHCIVDSRLFKICLMAHRESLFDH